MMPEPFRLPPLMGPAAYKTYSIAAPLATHFRAGTCAETGCPQYLGGWRTVVDESTDLGQRQAHYIRHDTSRRHAEERQPDGLTAFTFGPGQTCFAAASHRVRLDRPERFIIRGGDHRGNPRGDRAEVSCGSWTDDFGEHQQGLADKHQEG